MFPRTNKRKAISTVLTTMIILVASVVLGTGVVIYGTSLFQTGAQQEAIATQGIKVWVNSTDTDGIAWGAVGVRNSGDKLVSVDSIIVRGAAVPFTQWYVERNQTAVTTDNFQSQYVENNNDGSDKMKDSTSFSGVSLCAASATTVRIDFDGSGSNKPSLCLTQATGPTALNPGERMIIYFKVSNGIVSSVDSGSTSSVSVFAGKTGAPTSVTIGNF